MIEETNKIILDKSQEIAFLRVHIKRELRQKEKKFNKDDTTINLFNLLNKDIGE